MSFANTSNKDNAFKANEQSCINAEIKSSSKYNKSENATNLSANKDQEEVNFNLFR